MSHDPNRPVGPPIEPVPSGVAQPRWSVMIPTYNCARTLTSTIDSVLVQAPGPEEMEIVVVDDASSDDVEAVVARHRERVALHRQPKNLGVPANLTACIRLARGEIVHILHGDDEVRPGFYDAMGRAMAHPDVGAAFCRQIFADATGARLGISPLEQKTSGVIPDALVFLASEQRVMTPSICVRRSVYEMLGGFHAELGCSEDWEMWVRIAAWFPIWYEPEPLAVYRMQAVSNTGRNQRTGRDLEFTARAIEIISGYLPAPERADAARRSRATYAKSALEVAESAAERGDFETAVAQWKGALRLSRSGGVIARAVLSLVRIGGRSLRRAGASRADLS